MTQKQDGSYRLHGDTIAGEWRSPYVWMTQKQDGGYMYLLHGDTIAGEQMVASKSTQSSL